MTSTDVSPHGQYYEAVVPDTLDPAARAALAVNSLTGFADPRSKYETFVCAHLDRLSPYLGHRAGGPSYAEPNYALPMMRVISGNMLRADYALKMDQRCNGGVPFHQTLDGGQAVLFAWSLGRSQEGPSEG